MTRQLPSDLTTLRIETIFPDTNTESVFQYWTQPVLLQKWWPQEAEIEPWVGGHYIERH
jgi:uncharacterized protein YndB with AHSA1/START domain